METIAFMTGSFLDELLRGCFHPPIPGRWNFGATTWDETLRVGSETSPAFQRHRGHSHQCELADDESAKPRKCFLHEPVGMQADAEHVDAEPGEARDDVSEDRHDHQSALANESAPARVQNDRAPKDSTGAFSFRVPTPETSPRLIGPNAAEHGADKTEERGETNDAISHARERISRGRL